MILGVFAVRCVAGSRMLRAFGFAATTIFISDAERCGTLSTRAAFVRVAIINGNKPIVCAVFVLRRTKNGMKMKMKQLEEVKICYDATAEEYAKNFYDELSHKSLDRLLLKRFAEENQEGAIADLGCGCGHTTKFLRNAGAENIVGIDLSAEMIKIAALKNPGINFEVGNMLELAAENESFTAVSAFYSIVHFTREEVEKAFAEINRVMKPAGQFLFSFHVGAEETHLDEFLKQKVNITFCFFEVEEILKLLEKTGFRVLETVVRFPYKDAEYPSKRAYILAEKL